MAEQNTTQKSIAPLWIDTIHAFKNIIFGQGLKGLLLASLVTIPSKLAVADSSPGSTNPSQDESCSPPSDPKLVQYIIGYGSLMEDASRQRTAPEAVIAYPVIVQGYRRGWFAKGGSIGFDTTYLGALPDKNSKFNAVIYQIKDSAALLATDKREFFYCRRSVKPSEFTLLKGNIPTLQGQVWIYVNKPESVATPNPRYPIVQSYVDIFVSGCLEQEQRYEIKGFAQQCITTTSDWSEQWVNDRIYPRRPFIYEPKAAQIDELLSKQIPQYFQQIRIESSH